MVKVRDAVLRCRPIVGPGVFSIRLVDQTLEGGVDVARPLQPKVVAVAEAAIILGSNQTRVVHSAPKPQTSIQPRRPHDDVAKSHPLL